MSADTKYSASSNLLDGEIALTDHALHRYQQRTPHDCTLAPHVAWQRGEYLKHPRICQSDDHDRPPSRVRLYREPDWGICFIVDWDQESSIGADEIVVTVNNIRGFGHKPTRSYLETLGPHGGTNE